MRDIIHYSPNDRAVQSDYYQTRFERIRSSRFFPIAMVAASIVIFGSIVIYAYNQGQTVTTAGGAEAPLITADADPFKTKPVDAGGAEIPFQESLAYKQLEGNKSGEPGVENLLPPPEMPMDKPAAEMNEKELKKQASAIMNANKAQSTDIAAAFEDPIQTASNTKGKRNIAAEVAAIEPAAGNPADDADEAANIEAAAKVAGVDASSVLPTPALPGSKVATVPAGAKAASMPTDAKAAVAPKSAVANDDAIPTQDNSANADISAADVMAAANASATAVAKPATEEIKVAMAVDAPKDNVAKTQNIAGSWKVQLASFKDKAAAADAWAKMKKQYAPHLDNATMGITSADLGARGTYYRLNAINLSKDAATSMCDAIKTIKAGGCLVAK